MRLHIVQCINYLCNFYYHIVNRSYRRLFCLDQKMQSWILLKRVQRNLWLAPILQKHAADVNLWAENGIAEKCLNNGKNVSIAFHPATADKDCDSIYLLQRYTHMRRMRKMGRISFTTNLLLAAASVVVECLKNCFVITSRARLCHSPWLKHRFNKWIMNWLIFAHKHHD